MSDIQRYLSLITSEHADKPNFIAWLTAMLTLGADSADCAASMNDALDIDQAVGDQLDIVGGLVGVSRTVAFQPTGGVSPVLDDDTYRLAIRAKIAKNQWDGTIVDIQSIWTQLFGAVPIYLALRDNQDMTMTAIVIGMTDTIQQDLASHGYFVPKPEGVLLNITTPVTRLFALGISNSAFGGLGEGAWVDYSTL
jgi:hypothetical protein